MEIGWLFVKDTIIVDSWSRWPPKSPAPYFPYLIPHRLSHSRSGQRNYSEERLFFYCTKNGSLDLYFYLSECGFSEYKNNLGTLELRKSLPTVSTSRCVVKNRYGPLIKLC